jgi:predicted  nucleic acid-binding Zn-ribbon protein
VQLDVGGIKTEQTALRADVTTLRTDVTTLRTDVMARIDRLQDALTEQRASDVVTFGAADRAEKIVKSLQEDNLSLGEQISALTKMVRRLQTRVDKLEEGRGEGSPH